MGQGADRIRPGTRVSTPQEVSLQLPMRAALLDTDLWLGVEPEKRIGAFPYFRKNVKPLPHKSAVP